MLSIFLLFGFFTTYYINPGPYNVIKFFWGFILSCMGYFMFKYIPNRFLFRFLRIIIKQFKIEGDHYSGLFSYSFLGRRYKFNGHIDSLIILDKNYRFGFNSVSFKAYLLKDTKTEREFIFLPDYFESSLKEEIDKLTVKK